MVTVFPVECEQTQRRACLSSTGAGFGGGASIFGGSASLFWRRRLSFQRHELPLVQGRLPELNPFGSAQACAGARVTGAGLGVAEVPALLEKTLAGH